MREGWVRRKDLYSIKKSGGEVIVRFQTGRSFWLLLGLILTVFFAGFFVFALRRGWNSDIVSGIFGGSFGLTAVIWFKISAHVTRYAMFIDAELVGLRREFYGIPVESRMLYARSSLGDFGFYLSEDRGYTSERYGALCIWAGGKSIELERYFPISSGVALARDLGNYGVAFPRTFAQLSDETLLYNRSEFLSF
jgi:hypothetical protein